MPEARIARSVEGASERSAGGPRIPLGREVATTLVTVLLLLMAAELGFRSISTRLSKNSKMLADAPHRAEHIRMSEGQTTLLILGNSRSGEGVNAELLARQLGVVVEHQAAQASVLREWYYQLKNQFVARGAIPTWVVLPVGAPHPLERINAPVEDLFCGFLRPGDLLDFYNYDQVDKFEDRAGIAFSMASHMYCFRGRFQSRVLTKLISGFPELRLEATRVLGGGGGDVAGAEPAELPPAASGPDGEPIAKRTNPRWHQLFAKLTAKHGIKVMVIALPTADLHGRLPAADRAIAEGYGWIVLEPGADASWSDADVPDGMHLIPEARDRFTQMLARDMAPLLGGR